MQVQAAAIPQAPSGAVPAELTTLILAKPGTRPRQSARPGSGWHSSTHRKSMTTLPPSLTVRLVKCRMRAFAMPKELYSGLSTWGWLALYNPDKVDCSGGSCTNVLKYLDTSDQYPNTYTAFTYDGAYMSSLRATYSSDPSPCMEMRGSNKKYVLYQAIIGGAN